MVIRFLCTNYEQGSGTQPPIDRDGIVLIVDDDDSIRETLELVLQTYEYATATAAHGEEALAWLRQHVLPRLILLDLMMPVMDGWQLLEHLRQDDRLRQIPVIVITAFGRELGSAGRFPSLRKPVELKDLLSVVGTYLGNQA